MQDLNEHTNLCLNLLKEHDQHWMQRKRKLDTVTIFENLVNSSVQNIGVSTCLNLYNTCSHVAMCKARMKIQKNIFKTINQQLHSNTSEHIYAIDGSKIRVHNGFKTLGYKSRTCEANIPRKAKRPLAMLSSLSGVNSDTIHNYTVTKHFNERLVVPELISQLKPGDIVLLDRGYYSQKLFAHFVQSKIHCVMRLKRDANSIVNKFYSSKKHCLDSTLICKVTGKLVPIRYLKYIIDNKKSYCCHMLCNYIL